MAGQVRAQVAQGVKGKRMARYMKALVALCGAVSTWGVTAAVDGRFDAVEWFGLLGAVGAALAVAASPPNASEPEAPGNDQDA